MGLQNEKKQCCFFESTLRGLGLILTPDILTRDILTRTFYLQDILARRQFVSRDVQQGDYTAIPYRVSTGPEQGFPCVVFPHREKPVVSSWDPCNENRFFPVGNTTQGKRCFHYRDGFAVYSY